MSAGMEKLDVAAMLAEGQRAVQAAAAASQGIQSKCSDLAFADSCSPDLRGD